MRGGPSLLLAAAALGIVGCGSSEANAPEPAASTGQAAAAAAAWTPEMKDKFKAAHDRARAGQDERVPTGGK